MPLHAQNPVCSTNLDKPTTKVHADATPSSIPLKYEPLSARVQTPNPLPYYLSEKPLPAQYKQFVWSQTLHVYSPSLFAYFQRVSEYTNVRHGSLNYHPLSSHYFVPA